MTFFYPYSWSIVWGIKEGWITSTSFISIIKCLFFHEGIWSFGYQFCQESDYFNTWIWKIDWQFSIHTEEISRSYEFPSKNFWLSIKNREPKTRWLRVRLSLWCNEEINQSVVPENLALHDFRSSLNLTFQIRPLN